MSLEELLSMFDLNIPFTETDLKKAKKKVLMLHPDKHIHNPSIPTYYLKYLEAYKKLVILYNHIKHETNVEAFEQQDCDASFKDYVEKHGYKDKEFLKHFNHMFENVHIKTTDEEIGYETWLKSTEDYYDKDNIEKSRKTLISTLVKCDEPKAENVFGNTYYDLKEAHKNTIIAIDEQQVLKEKPKYKNVHEYEQHRKSSLGNIKTTDESKKILQQEYKQNTHASLKLAYEYKQRQEQMELRQKEYNSRFFTIL
jgi:hypothetical protein